MLAPERGGASASERQPGRLLIVEDDYLVSVTIETALLEAGFEVVGVANTAEQAVELARTAKPDLVIMDIRLAGERDGVDAAVALFRDLGLRCIFATAHQEGETRSRAEPARPLAWLAKPYQPRMLVTAVRRALVELGKA